jgi:alpha,alpha-trehalase
MSGQVPDPTKMTGGGTFVVNAPVEMSRLLREEDTDGDKKITIEDLRHSSPHVPQASFQLRSEDGKSLEVRGTYYLSNLLQELKFAEDRGEQDARIEARRVFENPVTRTSRLIREVYWDGLTRRIDADHLRTVLKDPKISAGHEQYLYVPSDDDSAFAYYMEAAHARPELRLKVVKLPPEITKETADELKVHPGLLTLALRKDSQGKIEGVPFVVPGGRFNEMYGWDSYFESLGLLSDGRVDLARAMVDNFVYEIRHYGKILNANRTYYLTRSQPPFLTSMLRAVWAQLSTAEKKSPANREWLAQGLAAAITEYENVWTDHNHLTATGLSRYFGEGWGVPLEVEPGHFDPVLRPYARKHRITTAQLQKLYDEGKIKEPELDRFLVNDRAVRESGHDTTYRWRANGVDSCADFVTVDLNSLLYKVELDIARIIQEEFNGEFNAASKTTSAEWRARALKRKELILKYLWNPEDKLFYDYDVATAKQSRYVSATTFYPLWTWDPEEPTTQILDTDTARSMVHAALAQLEEPGGLAATSETSLKAFGDPKNPRQWDFPNGWAPHQMIAWAGLRRYGFNAMADRLTYRWLYMVTRNAADYNGTIPEKFDVVRRSHDVFAEYGNVGTRFAYITREGFGWMNASYQLGVHTLSPVWMPDLERLVPPEWLKFE